MSSTKELGNLAENLAARHLEEKGYEIVDKNYRKPWGEIDIIAKTGETYVFVEVKANRADFGVDFSPEVRVDWRKRQKIAKTGFFWLENELRNTDVEWRIDVVSITFDELNKKAKISHYKGI